MHVSRAQNCTRARSRLWKSGLSTSAANAHARARAQAKAFIEATPMGVWRDLPLGTVPESRAFMRAAVFDGFACTAMRQILDVEKYRVVRSRTICCLWERVGLSICWEWGYEFLLWEGEWFLWFDVGEIFFVRKDSVFFL